MQCLHDKAATCRCSLGCLRGCGQHELPLLFFLLVKFSVPSKATIAVEPAKQQTMGKR